VHSGFFLQISFGWARHSRRISSLFPDRADIERTYSGYRGEIGSVGVAVCRFLQAGQPLAVTLNSRPHQRRQIRQAVRPLPAPSPQTPNSQLLSPISLVLGRPHWVTICHQNQVPRPMARAVRTWKWTNGPAAQVVTQLVTISHQKTEPETQVRPLAGSMQFNRE
jgi:hypothetical protein